MTTSIVWLRHDFRLTDNPALYYAAQHSNKVVPVYIHAPEEANLWQAGQASNWWRHHSLTNLEQAIAQRGGRLIIRQGKSLEELLKLCQELKASTVYWNQTYTPGLTQRDQGVRNALESIGVDHYQYNGSLLHTPGTILNKEGKPYRVFSAFWATCQRLGLGQTPLPAPSSLYDCKLASIPISELKLLPNIPWDQHFYEHWQPGEAHGLNQIERLCEERLDGYHHNRDYPAIEGTSRLSPYLALGEVSPRQIVTALLNTFMRRTLRASECDSFIREIGWREFAYHTLQHFPESIEKVLNPRFEKMPWQQNPELLNAWQQGKTGYPIIDAGMRELWQTGWMHNRVRMIVASFLTKNGMIHWQHGARWFWDTLVDADLASNSFNWQWVAGTGLDAAPYFRIFNPIRQSEKFDSKGHYIRCWLPELKALPDKWIHTPWKAPADILQHANISIGDNYPAPVLDLGITRKHALSCFKNCTA